MTRWLNDDQQAAWRAWIAASLLLPDRLSRDLQQREQNDPLTGLLSETGLLEAIQVQHQN